MPAPSALRSGLAGAVLLLGSGCAREDAEPREILIAAAMHARTVVPEGPLHLSSDGFSSPALASSVADAIGATFGVPEEAVDCSGPFGRCRAAPARGVIELSGPSRPTDSTAVVTLYTRSFPASFEGPHYAQGDEVHLTKRAGRWLVTRVRRLSET